MKISSIIIKLEPRENEPLQPVTLIKEDKVWKAIDSEGKVRVGLFPSEIALINTIQKEVIHKFNSGGVT